MLARAQLYESRLRVAHHYVDLVCKANTDYLGGFERSVRAVQLFDRERLQIDNIVNWLMAHAASDDAGTLLVKLLRDSYPLLYARLDAAQFRVWLDRGLETARRLGDVGAEAAHLLALGFAVRRTTSLEHSQPWFEQAVALARQHGEPRLLLRCLAVLARCYRDQGMLDQAARHNDECYALSHQLGDAVGMLEYYDLVGYRFYIENRLTDALSAYEQAYRWALRAGEYRQICLALSLMANVHYFQGDAQAAVYKARQAFDFSLSTQYPPVIIYTLHILGNALVAAQDRDGAREAYLKALRVAEQARLSESVALARAELGILAYRDHELDPAVAYLENAVEQLAALGARNYHVLYGSYLAVALATRGDAANAERTLRECVELAAQLPGDPQMILVVWAAVLVWINRAEHQSQPELTATMATLTGLVIASSHILPADMATLKNQLPRLAALLGDQPLAERLAAGEQLDLASVIVQLRRVIESWHNG